MSNEQPAQVPAPPSAPVVIPDTRSFWVRHAIALIVTAVAIGLVVGSFVYYSVA